MAFKLTADEKKLRIKHSNALAAGRDTLQAVIDKVNESIAHANDTIAAALDTYGEIVEEARGFVTDIVSQAEDDFSEKSERWQEGDNGQAAREWIDTWESLELEDATAEDIAEIECEIPDHAGDFDALPLGMGE